MAGGGVHQVGQQGESCTALLGVGDRCEVEAEEGVEVVRRPRGHVAGLERAQRRVGSLLEDVEAVPGRHRVAYRLHRVGDRLACRVGHGHGQVGGELRGRQSLEVLGAGGDRHREFGAQFPVRLVLIGVVEGAFGVVVGRVLDARGLFGHQSSPPLSLSS